LKTLGLEPVQVTLHPEVSVEIVANIARTNEEAKQQLKLGRAVIAADENSQPQEKALQNTATEQTEKS
jgi:large subunit ribosomal protein L9